MLASHGRLPASAARASAIATQAVGLVAVVGLAVFARTLLPLGSWYPAKAAGLFSFIMLVATGYVRGHHPFERLGPANQVTTARAVLVALVTSAIGEPKLTVVAASVAIVSVVATMLDGVDGWLARRTGMASAFGARFDVEIDALLVLALAILAWQDDKAGWWVMLSGLLRYLFIAAGLVLPWMRRPLPGTLRGKTICVLQILVLILVLVPAITRPLSVVLAASGLVMLSYSFAVDTRWLWRHRAAGDLGRVRGT